MTIDQSSLSDNYANSMNKKIILDACCGGRMMWFNKSHPNTIYIDKRKEKKGFNKNKTWIKIDPDIIADFKDLPFPDKQFKLVVFDPPHRSDMGKTSNIAQNYGLLNAEIWPYELRKGFKECWRVLDDYGILIFKWNDNQIKFKSVLAVFPVRPLFGQRASSRGSAETKWFTFMKIPDAED